MKSVFVATWTIASLMRHAHAQQIGTFTPEVHPSLPSQTCTSWGGCTTEPTKIVLDANLRKLHNVGGSTSCYNTAAYLWDKSICPDPVTCAKSSALEGADYSGSYGIDASNNAVSMRLVTKSTSGTNVGARIYLLEDDTKYKMFKLLNQEFTFDVDVSQLPCGLNGALYFVQMDQDGGKAKYPNNKAGAAYGMGYCDAQCARDGKFINGEANFIGTNYYGGKYGSCCSEMDIWEANKMSTAFNSHPCTVSSQYRCVDPNECVVCDREGCEFNAYRMNNKTLYGPGPEFVIDTTKPFTVVTRFLTDDKTANGNLVEIKRFYKQNGKMVENAAIKWGGVDPVASITDTMCAQTKKLFGSGNDHATKGGLWRMGESLKKGVVLAMSIWVDEGSSMLWLDSTFPTNQNPATPGVARGSCPTTSGKASELIQQVPGATVKFSNIRVGDIGSTTADSPPTPSPPGPPTPAPSPSQAGNCNALGAAACQSTFFCSWNELKLTCTRWWT